MQDLSLYVLVLLMTLAFLYFWKVIRDRTARGKSMPGPSVMEGWSKFAKGTFDKTLHLYLTEWAQKYGDVYRVNLLVKNVVVISNADAFRRLVRDNELKDFTNDRPPTFFREYINKGDNEIILAPFGPVLQHRRRVFHNILRFYGEGRGQFEELMLSTLEEFVQTFKGKNTMELSVDIRKYILLLLGFLLTGDISESGKKDLSKIQTFSKLGDEIFGFHNETLLQSFPALRFVPGLHFKRLYDNVCEAVRNLHNTYFYPLKKTFDPIHKRGLIDEMLCMQEDTDNGGSDFDDEVIKAMCQDVVAAGYLTTSSTLSSMFLHLITHPDIQARVYEEIKTVLGEATPGFRHKVDLPYTEAVILETMRISSTVPLLLPHHAKEDVNFDEFFIPKNSVLIMNAWHNHHRADFWKDPDTFNPDRFLDAKGQLLEADHPLRQKLIPFGSGRRACPGETFGKSRVFLIATFLLQRFQFLPPDVQSLQPLLDTSKWELGSVIGPANFHCKIKPRQS